MGWIQTVVTFDREETEIYWKTENYYNLLLAYFYVYDIQLL